MSSLPELEARIAALELAAKDSKVKLNDLPIAGLQRRLEQNWSPDAGVLLGPGSITSDLLAPDPVFATLPTTAPDGTVVAYQNTTMATLGVVWRFRYHAASVSGFKWEFIGGPPLMVNNDPTGLTTTTTVNATPINSAPSITIPRAGDYQYRIHAGVIMTSVGPRNTYLNPRRASDGFTIDPNNGIHSMPGSSTSWENMYAEGNISGLSAGDVFTPSLFTAVAGDTFACQGVAMSFLPVRAA